MKSFNFFPYPSRIKAGGLVTQGRQEGERERERETETENEQVEQMWNRNYINHAL